jgi:hypothetical protein
MHEQGRGSSETRVVSISISIVHVAALLSFPSGVARSLRGRDLNLEQYQEIRSEPHREGVKVRQRQGNERLSCLLRIDHFD